jgi:predicted transcriptional regulator
MVDILALGEVLVWLGFSVLQAKVYVALLETGKESIEALSKRLGISQSEVDRALCELEELGLVEERLL